MYILKSSNYHITTLNSHPIKNARSKPNFKVSQNSVVLLRRRFLNEEITEILVGLQAQ